ncbi:MAG: copper resistance CopC family protein [Thermomicrobiales bacterium]
MHAARWFTLSLFLAILAFAGTGGRVSAHATYDRSNPPANSVVPQAPGIVEIWFTEEITNGTTAHVVGPDGARADLGDATLDLYDPKRQHLTVSLRPSPGSGVYTVVWNTISGTDHDPAQGEFRFTVGAAAPGASPAASPKAGSPTAGGTVSSAATATAAQAPALTAIPTKSSPFDTKGYLISVVVGVAGAGLIFLFWRIVRPKSSRLPG